MQSDVMRHLKSFLAEAEHVDISQYQFINLENVEAAAGSMWPSVQNRVFVATRSIIERHISEDDLIIQCASGFLVIFQDLSGRRAQNKTDTITSEMQTFFLGDQFMKLIEIFSRSERVTLEEFAATLDAAQPEGLVDDENDIVAFDDPITDLLDQTPYHELGFNDVLYHAAWDPENEAVASFIANGRTRSDESKRWLWDEDLRAGRTKPEEHLALDLSLLELVGEELTNQIREQVRCGVVLPVSYAMLLHGPARTQFTTRLAQYDEEVRKHITLRVSGAKVDAPASQLNESCRTLLPYCGRLILHAPLEAMSLKRFDSIGAKAIGASLPQNPTHMLDQDISRLSALAKRAGCKVYFDQITSWDVLKAAMKSSPLFLAGSAIGEVERLRAPYRLTRAGVLSHAA